MINTSCNTSFQKEIFLPSNFRISTPGVDVEAMFFFRKESFTDLVFPFSFLYCFVVVEQQITLIPLDGSSSRMYVETYDDLFAYSENNIEGKKSETYT